MFRSSSGLATSTVRVGIRAVALLTFLSVVLLPSLSYAESIQGTFTVDVRGYENLFYNGQLDGVINGGGPGTFSFVFDPSDPSQLITGSLNSSFASFSFDGQEIDYYGGPPDNYVIGGYNMSPGFFSINGESPGGSIEGYLDFTVTYTDISPEGVIDPRGAKVSGAFEPLMDLRGGTFSTLIGTFETVPEPTSIVIAASAALTCLAYVWRRKVRARSAGSVPHR